MTTPAPAGIGPQVKTPAGDAPIVPLGLVLIGGYLAWFGVHYWKTDTKWPTDPVKSILTGKGLPANTATVSLAEQAVLLASPQGQAAQAAVQPAGTPGTTTVNQAAGQSSGVTSANMATGKLLAASYGWSTGQEWASLVELWDRESGWDNRIWNGGSHADTQPSGSSGAYGIAQSLPYTKYPKAGWPPGYGGSADPTSQISWGLSYIKSTYGTPSAAWQHEISAGWY